jgi:hypothetical protein
VAKRNTGDNPSPKITYESQRATKYAHQDFLIASILVVLPDEFSSWPGLVGQPGEPQIPSTTHLAIKAAR